MKEKLLKSHLVHRGRSQKRTTWDGERTQADTCKRRLCDRAWWELSWSTAQGCSEGGGFMCRLVTSQGRAAALCGHRYSACWYSVYTPESDTDGEWQPWNRMNEQILDNANLFLEHYNKQYRENLNLAVISEYSSLQGFTYPAELLSWLEQNHRTCL